MFICPDGKALNQADGGQQILTGFLTGFWSPLVWENCARQAMLPHRVSPGQAATMPFVGSIQASKISGLPMLTKI